MGKIAWFKVDDGFWAHPKTLALSNDAVALWVRAGSWSSQQLTDGRIAKHVLPLFAIDLLVANELVEAGYWEVEGDGWVFHDWQHYQPSAAETKSKRDEVSRKRAEAGRKGAESRWQTAWQTDGKGDGKPMASGNGKAMAPSRPVPSSTSNEVDIAPTVFEDVWKHWPKKDDKKDALARWPKAVREFGGTEGELAAIAIAHGDAYRAYRTRQFTPAFAVWLNKARWTNDLPEPEVSSATRQTAAAKNLATVGYFEAQERMELES